VSLSQSLFLQISNSISTSRHWRHTLSVLHVHICMYKEKTPATNVCCEARGACLKNYKFFTFLQARVYKLSWHFLFGRVLSGFLGSFWNFAEV
jgi:hypothetical protein